MMPCTNVFSTNLQVRLHTCKDQLHIVKVAVVHIIPFACTYHVIFFCIYIGY